MARERMTSTGGRRIIAGGGARIVSMDSGQVWYATIDIDLDYATFEAESGAVDKITTEHAASTTYKATFEIYE